MSSFSPLVMDNPCSCYRIVVSVCLCAPAALLSPLEDLIFYVGLSKLRVCSLFRMCPPWWHWRVFLCPSSGSNLHCSFRTGRMLPPKLWPVSVLQWGSWYCSMPPENTVPDATLRFYASSTAFVFLFLFPPYYTIHPSTSQSFSLVIPFLICDHFFLFVSLLSVEGVLKN